MKKVMKRWLLVGVLFGLSCSGYTKENVAGENQPKSVMPASRAGGWWGPRHDAKVNEIKRGDVELLMIGDSITHSWESGGKNVWAKYYKHRKAVNLGFSGDRTEHVIWRLQNGEVEGISPRLAVLMIGTNNAGHRKEASADTALGIECIIKELRTRLPETRILLLAVFPRGATPQDKLRKLNDGTNEIIAGFADNKHVFYLDINSEFLDDAGNLPKEIMPDLLHPNERGYQIWAEAMEPMVSKLMGQEEVEPGAPSGE